MVMETLTQLSFLNKKRVAIVVINHAYKKNSLQDWEDFYAGGLFPS